MANGKVEGEASGVNVETSEFAEHERQGRNSRHPVIPHKAWFALIAVAVAVTGVLTGLKWLTVAALVIWIVAMMAFGAGKRRMEED